MGARPNGPARGVAQAASSAWPTDSTSMQRVGTLRGATAAGDKESTGAQGGDSMPDVPLGADTDASRLTRRGLLYRGALTAAFAAALPLLEACGSAAQAPAGATSVPASGSASPSAAAGGAAAPAASPAGAASAGGLQ